MVNVHAEVKVKVDSTELDEVLAKVKELKEALWTVNGLLGELTDLEPIEIKLNTEVLTASDITAGFVEMNGTGKFREYKERGKQAAWI